MMRLTRRDFLGLTCQAVLFGCAALRPPLNPLLAKEGIKGRSDPVSIVRLDDPVKAIKMAIEMIDGLSFIKTGDTVLIKPAVNSEIPFPAATEPLLMSTVINMVRDRGAGAIIVAERSGVWRDTERCMKATGTYKAAVESKAEIVFLEKEDYIKVHPSLTFFEKKVSQKTLRSREGDNILEDVKSFLPTSFQRSRGWMFGYSLPKMLNKLDHIISLPTIRTHSSADFTMSLKNNMGFIAQWDRNWMHTSLRLQERIAELGLAIKPSLVVLDGRKAFCTGGPNKGELKSPGVIIAGRSMVACDALGLAVLKHIGTTKKLQNKSIWEISQIKRAIEIGLGSRKIEEIRHHGIDEIQELRMLVA